MSLQNKLTAAQACYLLSLGSTHRLSLPCTLALRSLAWNSPRGWWVGAHPGSSQHTRSTGPGSPLRQRGMRAGKQPVPALATPFCLGSSCWRGRKRKWNLWSPTLWGVSLACKANSCWQHCTARQPFLFPFYSQGNRPMEEQWCPRPVIKEGI